MALNDTFTAGQILTATEMNNLPFGLVGHTSATATTAIVANTPLSVLTLAVTIIPNRRYRIHGQAALQATGGAASVQMLYLEASGFTTQTFMFNGHSLPQFFSTMLVGTIYATAADFGVTTGSGTSKTLDMKIRMNAAGGLNTNPDAIIGANSIPQRLWIEDIGSA